LILMETMKSPSKPQSFFSPFLSPTLDPVCQVTLG
jgi:hypothetical protein